MTEPRAAVQVTATFTLPVFPGGPDACDMPFEAYPILMVEQLRLLEVHDLHTDSDFGSNADTGVVEVGLLVYEADIMAAVERALDLIRTAAGEDAGVWEAATLRVEARFVDLAATVD